jgi:TPR repeat protein
LPYTTTRAAALPAAATAPTTLSYTLYRPSTTAMDPEAMRRACVEFRVKLARDTGVNLTAADCQRILGIVFDGEGGEVDVTLHSDPGLFYTNLGGYLILPHHGNAAWFCFREAAEVHMHPGAMGKLGNCYFHGRGVAENPEQAAVWFQKGADLGDRASKAALGCFLLNGDPRAGGAKDTARGFTLVREAFAQGFSPALLRVAECYLRGEGVAKDAAHAVTLLRQATTHGGDAAMTARAQFLVGECYVEGA